MTNEEIVKFIQMGINKELYLEQLFTQNRGFILMIVKKFRYAYRCNPAFLPIIEETELINEAYFGLVKAVMNYDSSKGSNFLTYSCYWINQAIKRFLENSGRVIRVPIHMQEKIHKYNQVTSYFLNHYGRMPEKSEYADKMGISESSVYSMEKFMFKCDVYSLEEVIPTDNGNNFSIGDTVPSMENVEDEVIEKVIVEQVHVELWKIVAKVLKDDKKLQVFQLKYEKGLNNELIGKQLNLSDIMVNNILRKGIKVLRNNSRTKGLAIELGIR